MRRARAFHAIAAIVLTGAVFAGLPAVASADTAAMGLLKQAGAAAVQHRLTWLASLQNRVASATHLTSGDRASLDSLLSQDVTGLTALGAKIQADTDMTTLRNDVRTIADGYRVYVLVTPQVHLTIAADRVDAIATLFTPIEHKLQAAIDAAKAKGKDVAAAQAALDDLKAKVSAAHGAVTHVPSEVMALTPQGYPGNRSTLLAARASLQDARGDLRAARADVTTVLNDLRG